MWLPDNWKPKVVAVDIDGTLTNENKLIEPSVIDALQRLESAGIPVILATGNVRAITSWRKFGLADHDVAFLKKPGGVIGIFGGAEKAQGVY